ncbi:hypothetical protein [Methyloradius palustris]|uniref:Uncharacterized protein n=1 Tax=Methyloradius palustris TaxID=2778876 RepID=A0A8D5G0D3_9PROT|nr:hypothetical protein [Methyloradius palustris]BCM23828.1 hypothetical protein ZMTM_00870 [Methyloradius palustris]
MNQQSFDINSQEFYYHVSPIHLENGSIIKKGNWGRVIKLYIGNCNGLNLFKERVLEDVRLDHYSTKPSRLDAIFLLLNLDAAKHYLTVDNEAQRTSLIYKVKPLNRNAPGHLANYSKTIVQPPLCHFDNMEQVAHNYWTGVGLYDAIPMLNPTLNTYVPVTTVELIAMCDIEIVECLNLL